ncbi:lipoyl(octanoyl) transferase LipB [Herbiconiux sp. CPCC 205716]|uniref:Octanoyltransferase n=1 Tax=Herbiconiux gentiana TaxID=2970912 RepID=A0ABT2GCT1_9MICO|nr:lipoyl(octanoyl) transferase LipB [Herbiconiux gentiana]MCS5714003.1 lipoyl(octanoyl) transferase LipB [Herbiconiux gentiana]
MTDVLNEGVGDRLVPYLEGLTLQSHLHDRVVAGSAPDTLVLLEHEAVYTAGKRTEPSERPAGAAGGGTPVIDVDRGGKITWHGPGQLVGYPIVRLPDPIDVVAYVRMLEQLLLDVVASLGVDAHRVEGRSGIWTTLDGREHKLGAIGIRVASGVTTHGFALNCSNPLEPYDAIVACGIRDAGVTTLSEVLGRRVEPRDVVEAVVARFESPREAAGGHPVIAAPAPASAPLAAPARELHGLAVAS